MNLRKNKTLITVVVLLVALGLIAAYVPLLFAPQPSSNPVYLPQEEQQEQDEVIAEQAATTTPFSSEQPPPLPESFSGLEEESESLEGILEGF